MKGNDFAVKMAPPSSCDILKHRYIKYKKHTFLLKERKEFPFRGEKKHKLQISHDDAFQFLNFVNLPLETLIPLTQQ